MFVKLWLACQIQLFESAGARASSGGQALVQFADGDGENHVVPVDMSNLQFDREEFEPAEAWNPVTSNRGRAMKLKTGPGRVRVEFIRREQLGRLSVRVNAVSGAQNFIVPQNRTSRA